MKVNEGSWVMLESVHQSVVGRVVFASGRFRLGFSIVFLCLPRSRSLVFSPCVFTLPLV